MKPKHKLNEVLISLMKNSRDDRNSDYELYVDYIKFVRPDILPHKYYEVMRNYKIYGIYSFKAVERERRAIQSEARKTGDIELLSDKQVEKWRMEQQEKYAEAYNGR